MSRSAALDMAKIANAYDIHCRLPPLVILLSTIFSFLQKNQQALIDYEGNSNGGPDETFNIMLDDSAIYEMENLNEDWKKNEAATWKSGETIMVPAGVELKKNGKINMNGLKPDKNHNSNGNGNGNGNKRYLKARTEEQQRDLNQLHRQLGYSTTTGTKKVVAVRVVATGNPGGSYSYSEDYLRNEVFGTSGDTFNLRSGYAQCSYNQLLWTLSLVGSVTALLLLMELLQSPLLTASLTERQQSETPSLTKSSSNSELVISQLLLLTGCTAFPALRGLTVSSMIRVLYNVAFLLHDDTNMLMLLCRSTQF
jgi:hypothetical protein